METNLEKAKRLIKANAAIQGIELPDNGFIFEMLELAAKPNIVNKNLIKPDLSGSIAYAKVSKLLSALNDIRNWDDDLEDKWEDQGYRAKAALAEYYKETDF